MMIKDKKTPNAVHKSLIYYSIIVVAFIIISLECLVRLLHLAQPLPPHYTQFVKGPCLPFMMQPNSVFTPKPFPKGNEFQFEYKTNSLGFRDREHSFEKPQGVYRILALGDSYNLGAGARYEGSYPYQLQEQFNRRSGVHPRIEVINAGQSRYWPEPERILLETIGIKFKPDIILVGFNAGDVSDTYEGMNYIQVRQGYLITREAYGLGNSGRLRNQRHFLQREFRDLRQELLLLRSQEYKAGCFRLEPRRKTRKWII